MSFVYLGIFIPQKSMDQLLVPLDMNIKHPHITMKYYGGWNCSPLTPSDHLKVGVHTEIQPWGMITSKDIDVIICRRSHQGMGPMPHITLRVSNGALPVHSNRFADAYSMMNQARVFDSRPNGPEQRKAIEFFEREHPDAKIFRYGSIAPIAARWGAFDGDKVVYELPPLEGLPPDQEIAVAKTPSAHQEDAETQDLLKRLEDYYDED